MNKTVSILCVDDEPEICFALKTLFLTQGWNTSVCLNVKDALATFRLSEPDIVLMDYHMPDINGVEGVRLLRELSSTVPIIVFTSDEDQAVADAFMEAGANDFALKPIKPLDIVSRIRLHMRLLESMSQNTSNKRVFIAKGISPGARDLIIECIGSSDVPVTASEIADATGLAYQTVSRYLQHLTDSGEIVMETIYGKVGRPKQKYYLQNK